MNFSLLRVEHPKKLKRISKSKINLLKKDEEISLFHFNELYNGLFHAVYYLQDEYKIGTKKLGVQHNYAYSSLINFFFSPESPYAFIEYVNNEYQKESIREIEKKANTTMQVLDINNNLFNRFYKELQGTVKKINYSNDDGELLDLDFVSDDKFNQILKDNIIDGITILFDNKFVTITNEGRISVNNSEENYVYNFIKRILDAMD